MHQLTASCNASQVTPGQSVFFDCTIRKVHNTHRSVDCVLAARDARNPQVRFEENLAMAARGHSVVNQQVYYNGGRVIRTEADDLGDHAEACGIAADAG